MREYLTVPRRVEVVRAHEIISALEDGWRALPNWAGESYDGGQIVVATTGVTLFNGSKAVKAQVSDFVVRDHNGFFSVYDERAFNRNFVPAHSAEVVKLHAA